MAKNDSKARSGPSFNAPVHRPRWVAAILCALIGLLFIVAFGWYEPDQPRFMGSAGESLPDGTIRPVATATVHANPVGGIGADVAFRLFSWFGAGAWLIGCFFFWLAYIYSKGIRRLATARVAAMLFCLTCACGLLAMQDVFFERNGTYIGGAGGFVGQSLYETVMRDTVGTFGSGAILAVFFGLSAMFVMTRDLGAWFDRFFAWLQSLRERWKVRQAEKAEMKRVRQEARSKLKQQAAVELKKQTTPPAPAPGDVKKLTLPKGGDMSAPSASPSPAPMPPPSASRGPLPPPPKSAEKVLSLRGNANGGSAPQPVQPPTRTPPPPPVEKPAPPPAPAAKEAPPAPVPVAASAALAPAPAASAESSKLALKIVAPEVTRKAAQPAPTRSDDYIFPPLDVLKEQVKSGSANEEEHFTNAETLLRTLGEFGVEVSLGEVHTGPVITRYEITPAPGVRVEKIAGLDKNIALGMRAQSVRILAPVPGKGVVGVEVPNQKPTPVGLREILESADWAESKAELPVALGKDVSGAPIVADLARMPHLLIAGATGSGKSVCVNSIIASLVYHAGPKKVRLLMVDPKIVELQIYNALPHMLIPVVTEPKKVPGALKWLLAEMEKRYQIFAKCGVRNIVGFNTRKPGEKPKEETAAEVQQSLPVIVPRDVEIEIPKELPYIVCIIDELADLMMVAPAEIETSIARLAQLARAAGIHLIVATQRPSVNIITGSIKANLPSRIAFQVTSKVDSRVILDEAGADQLIGRGDLLFMPPGTSRLVRAQGAFVSDEEIHRVVEHLKKNGPPAYRQEVQEQVDRSTEEEGEGEEGVLNDGSDDELLPQAIGVLKATRRASTSMLQRRLRIGYNRAARLMELLEQKGIVGPENGAQPRDILADLDQL